MTGKKHKKKERNQKGQSSGSSSTGYLSGIASTMPALRWSEKIQKRASHHGFDWETIEPVFAKIYEEIDELRGRDCYRQQSGKNL